MRKKENKLKKKIQALENGQIDDVIEEVKWTCQRCFNHNDKNRENCKTCYMSLIESNRLLYGQAKQRFVAART